MDRMHQHRAFALVLVLTALLVPAHGAAQDTAAVGGVTGTVVGADGAPAAGVKVCLAGTTRCATSDDRGRFHLTEIRAGRYQLEITPVGQPGVASPSVEVRAGLDAVVDVSLPKWADVQQTVTVTAPAFVPPEEVKTSSFLVRPSDIRSSAGGLQDVSRFVQTLPGAVIGTNDFRNDIIVRGGSPLENLFIVDNVEIPNINAFANFSSAGGTVSLIDTELVQDVTFLTGGYPAPYTNRVSSVLQISQREGDRERFRSRATLGFAGAGAIVEGPLAGGKGSWVMSARRSFLDLFTKDAGFGGVPVLYTFNAKAVYDKGANDRLWLVNISGLDRIRLGLTDKSDLTKQIGDFDIRYRGWRSATGFNWQHIFGQRGVGLFGVTYSRASVTSTVKDLVRNGIPDPSIPVPDVIAAGPLVFREGSSEAETTLKYDLTVYARMLQKVQIGGSAKLFQLNYDTGSPLGDDSPYSAVPGVNAFTLRRAFRTTQSAAYVQTTQDVTRRLNLTWGARVDDYRYINRVRISPRVGVSYRLTDHLSWGTSAGSYYQQPFFLFLAAFPGNADLKPFRADHYVTGLSYRPNDAVRVTVELYRKNYRDYPVSSQFRSLSLANVGDTFNVREVLFPMVSEGRGHAEGVEVFAEKKSGGRWYGQANIAVSRVRQAGLDGVLRPGSFDYPFVLNMDGGYRLGTKWSFSTRLAYLTGRPFTPFDVAASAAQRRGIFDLAQVNADRAPDYFRLDLRLERTFGSAERPITFFGGVQNVTNRKNFGANTWNRRLGQPQVQEQMGIFPILGFDWRF